MDDSNDDSTYTDPDPSPADPTAELALVELLLQDAIAQLTPDDQALDLTGPAQEVGPDDPSTSAEADATTGSRPADEGDVLNMFGGGQRPADEGDVLHIYGGGERPADEGDVLHVLGAQGTPPPGDHSDDGAGNHTGDLGVTPESEPAPGPLTSAPDPAQHAAGPGEAAAGAAGSDSKEAEQQATSDKQESAEVSGFLSNMQSMDHAGNMAILNNLRV